MRLHGSKAASRLVLLAVLLAISACGPSQTPAEAESLRTQREAERLIFTPHYSASERAGGTALLEQALAVRERGFGTQHPSLVPLLMQLGRFERVLSIQDRYPKLVGDVAVYRRTRSLFSDSMTDLDAQLLYEATKAVALNGLGARAALAGDTALAGKHYREALKVLEGLEGLEGLESLFDQFYTVAVNWTQQGNDRAFQFWLRRMNEAQRREALPSASSRTGVIR